jgi:hypothetical protein
MLTFRFSEKHFDIVFSFLYTHTHTHTRALSLSLCMFIFGNYRVPAYFPPNSEIASYLPGRNE